FPMASHGSLPYHAHGSVPDWWLTFIRAGLSSLFTPASLGALIRLLHEFNGTWYTWSGFKNGKNADKTLKTWIHIVDIFRKNKAHNAKWLWSPNGIGGGTPDSDSWNHIENYWPGSEYVDWIAFDAYNFYPEFEGKQPLATFENCFRTIYDQVSELSPKTPLMIAEFGTGEYEAETFPHNKSEWIKDAFQSLINDFPRIEWIFWFNVCKERE
ncbi:MAG: glycosyl hydrolase, partial [Verrucomicrobiota bacterium]|nr:glycosyl hydrolase [Verrucomicrobiota bacterium]